MSLKSLAVAVAVVFMLPVGSASAEVRSGSVVDPADSTLHLNVNGTSYRDQDIQRITASYDTAGSIALTVYFLDPVPASSPEVLQVFFSPFTAGSCSAYTTPAGYALMTMFTSSSFTGASVGLDGYEGGIGGSKTMSADHRAITAQVSSPMLANRDYSCVGAIKLHHYGKVPWHCDSYFNCSDSGDIVTDTADVFGLDAATPADPGPEPEGTVTDTPSDTDEDTAAPTARCVAARTALRTKQKQVKKLQAQRRATHKRARKRTLDKRITTAKRSIVKTKAVISQRC